MAVDLEQNNVHFNDKEHIIYVNGSYYHNRGNPVSGRQCYILGTCHTEHAGLRNGIQPLI